jgi:hypothetical protein
MGLAVLRWGITPATGYAAGAARHPHRLALVDDDGPSPGATSTSRTDRLASELRAGAARGGAVGLLARNGRGLVEGAVALAKCGADVLYLNTGSAADPLAQVLDREKARMVLHDASCATWCRSPDARHDRAAGRPRADLAAGAPPKPRHTSRQVILTSGTDGRPPGAAPQRRTVEDADRALSAIPLRGRETTVPGRAGLPRLGPRAPVAGDAARVHGRAPAALRPAPRAGRRRGAPRDGAGRRPGHAGEAARRDEGEAVRHLRRCGSRLQRQRAARGTWSSGCRRSWAGALQPLRLDGGGVRRGGRPAGPRRGPAHRRRPPHGVTLRVVDEQGRTCPPARPGASSSGSGLSFGGYTDGSDKDRWTAGVHRRPRACCTRTAG